MNPDSVPTLTTSYFPIFKEEDLHVILPLDENLSPLLEVVPLIHHVHGPLVDLYPAVHAASVHPARNVDGIAPDVVVELGGPDDPTCDVTIVEADSENEVKLDQGLIEVLDGILKTVRKLHELLQVLLFMLVFVPDERIEARGCHERRSNGFYLFNISEFSFI